MKPIVSEDIELLREFILLPIVLTVFERDKKIIESSQVKISSPYVETINWVMDRVIKDLSEIKEQMRKRGIKVVKESHTTFSLRYEFLCRGFRDVFEMPREFVKAETEVRMSKYLMGK